jgi:WXXGXW repeat (2 copies)
MRKRVFAIALAAAAIVAGPAFAQVNVFIGTPPPPPRVEVVPAPRAGHVWAPGFWRWDNGRHVWANGHWIEARRGQHWVPDHWVKYRDSNRDGWRHDAGHWDRDG